MSTIIQIDRQEIQKLIAEKTDWYVIHSLSSSVAGTGVINECVSKIGIIKDVTGTDILNSITGGHWKTIDYTDDGNGDIRNLRGEKLDGNVLTFLEEDNIAPKQLVSWADEETGISLTFCPATAITKTLKDF